MLGIPFISFIENDFLIYFASKNPFLEDRDEVLLRDLWEYYMIPSFIVHHNLWMAYLPLMKNLCLSDFSRLLLGIWFHETHCQTSKDSCWDDGSVELTVWFVIALGENWLYHIHCLTCQDFIDSGFLIVANSEKVNDDGQTFFWHWVIEQLL